MWIVAQVTFQTSCTLWSMVLIIIFFIGNPKQRVQKKKNKKLSIRHQNGVIERNLLFVWSTVQYWTIYDRMWLLPWVVSWQVMWKIYKFQSFKFVVCEKIRCEFLTASPRSAITSAPKCFIKIINFVVIPAFLFIFIVQELL